MLVYRHVPFTHALGLKHPKFFPTPSCMQTAGPYKCHQITIGLHKTSNMMMKTDILSQTLCLETKTTHSVQCRQGSGDMRHTKLLQTSSAPHKNLY